MSVFLRSCHTLINQGLITLAKLDNQPVSLLKLNRPRAKNAFSLDMMASLEKWIENIQRDSSVRCVIVSSAVDGVFSAGADLKEKLSMNEEETERTVKRLSNLFTSFSRLPVPTIAVVEGAALGGGAEFALTCDIRIGGEKSRFAFPETRLAIIPGAGGTQRLPRLIGPSKAKELIFTGRSVDAKESLSLGLINSLSPDPMETAMKLASEICQAGSVGIRMAKKAIDEGLEVPLAKGLDIESACYAETLGTKDRVEALIAFKEKRKPEFKGQ